MIISSVGSGILVSRTGKYKPILMAGLAVMAVGLYLMSNLRADTELPVLWSWMFVTGLGIGPTLAVFTIVVQNAVPVRSLGVATSNLTFFRQIGGSVGLAALGTVFGTRLAEEIPVQIAAAGVPQQMVDQFAAQSSGGSATDLIRRRRGPRRHHPGGRPAAAPGGRQADHPEHRVRDPAGLQPRGRPGVPDRRGQRGRRAGRRHPVHAPGPAPQTGAPRQNLVAEAIEESQAAGAGVPSDPGVMLEPALD